MGNSQYEKMNMTKPVAARHLPEHVDRRTTGVERANRLQRMRSLIGQIHARTGLDKAYITDFPILYQTL